MATDAKTYREYLDKEMTIMGILSAVAIAAPAGVLNALFGEKSYLKDQLLGAGPFFVIFGSICCVVAAGFFYKERSWLARNYGQMCLIESMDDSTSIPSQLRDYMRRTDSWESWIWYSWGFTALNVGFVEYASAIFVVLARPHAWYFVAAQITGRVSPFWAILVAFLQYYVLKRYSFQDEPWSDFRSDARRLFMRNLPHNRVYARLKPSSVSGVGVFAIRDIPSGTYVFSPDDDAVISISARQVGTIEPELQRLYEDFCVLRGDRYLCPTSFNKLTPAWYLNNSEDPNLAADLSLKFYAIRDIRTGEELTADYSAYSENKLAPTK